jgi:hypothetical protein
MNVNEVKTEEQARRFLDEQERVTQNTTLIANMPAGLKRYVTSEGVTHQIGELGGSSAITPIYFLQVKNVRGNEAELTLHWFIPEKTGAAGSNR